MQRLIIVSTVSRGLRGGRRKSSLLGPRIYGCTLPPLLCHHILQNTLHHHHQCTTFSSNSITKISPEKRGIFARFQRMIRTIFGATDDTPRGLQERQDMYWILLTVAHRNLRMANQRVHHLRSFTDDEPSHRQPPLTWQLESNEELEKSMDDAVTFLDEKTDLSEKSILRLRNEMQTYLEPQIVRMLTVAHDVSEAMRKENDDDYTFDDEEEQEYKEILLSEYENVCQLLQNTNAVKEPTQNETRMPDPVPFYEIKKGGIETLLNYFGWWPSNTQSHIKSSGVDGEDGVDNFGFSPTTANSEIVPAMRYYHVRNLVRSSLVRRAVVNPDLGNDMNESEGIHQSYFTYSLLPYKSTIPFAGRGVFIDGFAPAGTLLSFIPGKVWLKEHLQSASLQTQLQLSQNDPRHQLSMRYDDILIDSRHSPYTVVKNLWALGHIINHPPAPITLLASVLENAGRSASESVQDIDRSSNNVVSRKPRLGPNCVTVPINFTELMLEGDNGKLRSYLPNEYEIPPVNVSKGLFEKSPTIMHGMGLVALRDVKDEELVYDYRLSPGEGQQNQYPSWYHIWDENAINNRWDSDDS